MERPKRDWRDYRFRIDDELRNSLSREAENKGISMAGLIRMILLEHVRQEQNNGTNG
jgi:antitoxin component of RelBE/YafQ-DinJ toxin-antitoxin module